MLGGLSATCGDRTIARFQTRQTGLLLAYLAHFVGRTHSREALVELLWPEGDPESGRNRFRVALASLRRQLEPPGVQPNSVVRSDRSSVSLNADACEVDSATFQRLVEGASKSNDPSAVFQLLFEADALFRGEFLHGWLNRVNDLEQFVDASSSVAASAAVTA